MEDRSEYRCNVCNKFYASYKSRWLHIKKYHNNNVVNCSKNVVINEKNVVINVVIKHYIKNR